MEKKTAAVKEGFLAKHGGKVALGAAALGAGSFLNKKNLTHSLFYE